MAGKNKENRSCISTSRIYSIKQAILMANDYTMLLVVSYARDDMIAVVFGSKRWNNARKTAKLSQMIDYIKIYSLIFIFLTILYIYI